MALFTQMYTVVKTQTQLTAYLECGHVCACTHTDTQCSTCQLYFNKIDKTIINPRQVLLAASQTAMATEGLNMED